MFRKDLPGILVDLFLLEPNDQTNVSRPTDGGELNLKGAFC